MLPSGKWIDGIDAHGTVAEAARRSLQPRLMAVVNAVPLAAYLAAHDVEHVHRLRVATRRAIAALKLYRDGLPGKPARWLKRRLKKIRRAAGDARDLDVLGKRLAREYGDRAESALECVAVRRRKAQAAIVDVAERCRRDDCFIRKVGKLLDGVESSSSSCQSQEFSKWAASQLEDASKAFFNQLPNDAADTSALHEFRIRGKELRYTIELVAAAFNRELRDEYYPAVEELQERLGNVQDHVTAIAQLREWLDDADSTEERSGLSDIAEDERERLIDAVNDYRQWWTDERVESLRAGLNALVHVERQEVAVESEA